MTDPTPAIHDALQRFIDGWNADDIAAHTEMFTADATFVDRDAIVYHGKQAVVDHEAEARAGSYSTSTARTQEVDIRFVHPEVAIVHHRWCMTDPGGALLHHGLFTYVMTRSGDDWLMETAHNTFGPAPA